MTESMTPRSRFLAAAHCQPVDKTPVWVMRQAGRYLPEYRALKEKYSFVELAQTPELAVEVTLQPLRRFPLDAAILFSDILVIPEAMGQPYSFRDKGGIEMAFTSDSAEAVDRLQVDGAVERLNYVREALTLLRARLGNRTALLGFGGSPWTLATYMVEGGSSKSFTAVKSMFYSDRELFEKLMNKLTEVLIDYFRMQIEAGVDVIQIFDSWANACPLSHYREMSLQWMTRIVKALPENFPVILYARGMGHLAGTMAEAGAQVVGLDWSVDLASVRDSLDPQVAVQGNLDPALMSTTPEIVERETRRLMQSMSGKRGHIFNLGHGILPTAKIENMEILVKTVHNFEG